MEVTVMVAMAETAGTAAMGERADIEGRSGRKRGTSNRALSVALIVVALCAACSFSKDRKEAEQLADQYFAKVQSEDLAGALSLYSARFYEATSRADWLAILESQRDRCGTPKTHKLVSWNVFSSFGTNAGVRTTLVYDVQYSSCRMSEKMIIFKPDDGKIQIQGHSLNAGPQKDKAESPATLRT